MHVFPKNTITTLKRMAHLYFEIIILILRRINTKTIKLIESPTYREQGRVEILGTWKYDEKAIRL